MKEKISKISGLTAIGTAILSSSCCILPIVAVTFGFGIGGAAAFLNDLRPYLLTVTFLLLGFSFYLVYFKKRKSDCSNGVCDLKGSSKTTRVMLWIIAILAIIISLFPNY